MVRGGKSEVRGTLEGVKGRGRSTGNAETLRIAEERQPRAISAAFFWLLVWGPVNAGADGAFLLCRNFFWRLRKVVE